MVQTKAVYAGEGVGNLAGDPCRLEARQRPVVDDLLERLAGRVLTDDVGTSRRVRTVHGVKHPKEAGIGCDRGLARGGEQQFGSFGSPGPSRCTNTERDNT